MLASKLLTYSNDCGILGIIFPSVFFFFECQKILEPNWNVHGSCIFSFQVTGGDSRLVLSCIQREWFVDIVIKRAIEAGEGVCKEGGM